MQDIQTTSSLLRDAAYDEEAQELHLTFRSNGSRWIYGDAAKPFTQDDVDDLTGAPSQGKWFLEQIRPQWPARRA